MTKNRDLRVFVANGYYDLATPFAATDYTLAHLGLDPSLRGNVTIGLLRGRAHDVHHKPSHEKLRRDLVAFLAAAEAQRSNVSSTNGGMSRPP